MAVLDNSLISVYQVLNATTLSIRHQLDVYRKKILFRLAPARISTRYESVTLPVLGSNLWQLQHLANECHVELSTVWQTALAITLHVYNPSEALTFAYDGDRSELEKALGDKSAVCSLRIDPSETTQVVLQRFYASRNEDNAQGPFAHQISWTQQKFCGVAIRWQANSNIRRCPLSNADIRFVPSLAKSGRLTACLEYLTERISHDLAWSLLYTFDAILTEMRKFTMAPIEGFSICSQYDRQLVQRLTSSVAQAQEMCVHEIILDQCRATPDAIAIHSVTSDTTYAALERLTSKLAHYLVERGVGPEVFIMCCFEKSSLAIITRLAILRAGGAYIMVDARNPPTYLKSIIHRANISMMLTSPKFATVFQNLVPTVLEISEGWVNTLPKNPRPPCVSVKPENACLVLFTSGSTGLPKGIIQTHRSYSTAITNYARVLKFGPETRLFQFDDYCFDISNNDYLAPLMTGGCCCVPQPFEHTIPALIREINSLQPTATFLTPTVAVQLDPDQVKSLKLIFIGGETMAKDVLRKWSGKANIVNQYGMGEVATFCAVNSSPTLERASNVGRPRCNTIWLVSLSSPEQLVPFGAVGEVLIEGPNIARGYLDGLVRTAGARFLDSTPHWMAEMHPSRKASPMYLSGDLARYTQDGTIEYVGRKDLLLKVDGGRVDATEVEHCARKALSDNDAIMVDLLGGITASAQPVLVAYVYLHDHPMSEVKYGGETIFKPSTLCPQASRRVAEIEATLQRVLTHDMIPRQYLIVNHIPKTASKKTDRKKLHAQAEKYWTRHLLDQGIQDKTSTIMAKSSTVMVKMM